MPRSRATSDGDVRTGGRAPFGADLHLDLAGRGVRAGLEEELRAAVGDGRLEPGARLPSSRALAAELGVGRNSVGDAYGQLVAEGWLQTRHGAGTFVAERPPALPPRTGAPASSGPGRSPSGTAPGAPASSGASSAPEARTATGPQPPAAGLAPRYDLRPGRPDLAAFPRAAWLAAARRALAVAAAADLGYQDPRGLPVLRAALAAYLARARRVAADPDRIVVCTGFAHGLQLLGTVLRGRGARALALEAYGHELHGEIVAAAGLERVTVPVDERGARIADLDDAAGAVLLTPAHQFPLGVALDPGRRRAAVRWAADTGGFVIEDDYDGEFRYDRQAVGAMQSLGPEQVVYAGTAAKSLAPGLRLGWLVLPEALVHPAVDAKRTLGASPSTLDQLALAELIAAGDFDRHVRRARLAYRRRRDRLVSALQPCAPAVAVSGIAAGLHALVHLADVDERGLTARAAERHDLALQGLRDFTAPGHERGPALVVGYAAPPEHAYTATLARLRAVLTA